MSVEPMDADEAAEEIRESLGHVRKRMRSLRFEDDQVASALHRCRRLLDDLVEDYQRMEGKVEEATASISEVNRLEKLLDRIDEAVDDLDRGLITFTELKEIVKR